MKLDGNNIPVNGLILLEKAQQFAKEFAITTILRHRIMVARMDALF